MGVSHPDAWAFVDTDPAHVQPDLAEMTIRVALLESAGSFCRASIAAFRCATTLVAAVLARPDTEEWIRVPPRRAMNDSARKRLKEFRVAWVPSHLLSQVIGEFGATRHNMEAETGATFDIGGDQAVCIYADTEVIVNKAMQRILDIVCSSRCVTTEDGWHMLHK